MKIKLVFNILLSACLFFNTIDLFSLNFYQGKNCLAEELSYKVGERGPTGGWIFYDKGFISNGWRYLEAAPNDLGPTKWGCLKKIIKDAQFTAIGSGESNTKAILENCSDCLAAKLASEYSCNSRNDWFLPSKNELNAMYINLHKKNIGNFNNIYYWSSSEKGKITSWYQSFGTGDQSYNDKDYHYGLIRPIRKVLLNPQ